MQSNDSLPRSGTARQTRGSIESARRQIALLWVEEDHPILDRAVENLPNLPCRPEPDRRCPTRWIYESLRKLRIVDQRLLGIRPASALAQSLEIMLRPIPQVGQKRRKVRVDCL